MVVQKMKANIVMVSRGSHYPQLKRYIIIGKGAGLMNQDATPTNISMDIASHALDAIEIDNGELMLEQAKTLYQNGSFAIDIRKMYRRKFDVREWSDRVKRDDDIFYLAKDTIMSRDDKFFTFLASYQLLVNQVV